MSVHQSVCPDMGGGVSQPGTGRGVSQQGPAQWWGVLLQTHALVQAGGYPSQVQAGRGVPQPGPA